MAGWNFTKLQAKVVKLSLQYQFVLKFRKVAPFLRKGFSRKGVKFVVLPLKFNMRYETEKLSSFLFDLAMDEVYVDQLLSASHFLLLVSFLFRKMPSSM